jgi:hypothetical protein
MKLEFFWRILETYLNMKYQKKKSVKWEPSCSMQTDGQTDMLKLTVAFAIFQRQFLTDLLETFKHQVIYDFHE